MEAHKAGIVLGHWTDMIRAETRKNMIEKMGVSAEHAEVFMIAVDATIPTVTGFKDLIAEMPNDAKDRHVLAAAVYANLSVIVTDNIKDFRGHDFPIDAMKADAFFMRLAKSYPLSKMSVMVRADQARYKRSFPDYLESLAERQKLRNFAAWIEQNNLHPL